LIAIVVVAIVMTGITPLVFAVVGSRVQQRRAEQAQQLAQAEVDRVRTIVERGVYTINDLPADAGSNNLTTFPVANAIYPQLKSTDPAKNTYIASEPVPSTVFLPVDTTGDGKPDFLVQSFRTTGIPTGPTGTVPNGFRMGVRVYVDTPLLRDSLAKGLLTNPTALNPKIQASLTFTTGLGEQAFKPLSVLYSTIVRSDAPGSLDDYRSVCPAGGGC
jgi:type II secretory pathway pseudopilin PulG